MRLLAIALALTGSSVLAQGGTNGIVNTQGGVTPSLPIRAGYDLNSLVPGDLMRREWNLINTACCGGAGRGWITRSQLIGTDVLLDGVDFDGVTASGLNGVTFTVPPGTTSVTVSIPIQKVSGGPATAIGLALTHGPFSVVDASTGCIPTAAIGTCSVTFSGLTPGTIEGVVVANNGQYGSTNGSRALIGRVQATPNTSTIPILAASFERFGLNHGDVWYNTRTDYYADGTMHHSPLSVLSFRTSATSMVVGVEASTTPGSTSAYAVFVDGPPGQGYAVATHEPSAASVEDFFTVALPPGDKQVSINSGFQSGTTVFNVHEGNYFKDIFFPAGSNTLVTPPARHTRSMVFYGDSIISGSGSAIPALNGTSQLIRQRWPGHVYIEAWGGRSLLNDTSTAAIQTQFVNLLTVSRPSDIYIQVGVNDYNLATMTAAVFQTTLGSLLDSVHAALPSARIFVQSLTITTLESTNNANSEKPPAFRTSQQNACSARAWCNFIDGSAILATSDLADTIHPTVEAQQKYIDSIISSVEANSLAASVPSTCTTASTAAPASVGCTTATCTANNIAAGQPCTATPSANPQTGSAASQVVTINCFTTSGSATVDICCASATCTTPPSVTYAVRVGQ